MRRILCFVCAVLVPVAGYATAPWRTVAASGQTKVQGSYKNCKENPGKGENKNEVLYLTKNDNTTVHFVCQKDLCGSDTVIAVLDKGCVGKNGKCHTSGWFKCSISALDDGWTIVKDYNNRIQSLKSCSKAGTGYVLTQVSNSHKVLVVNGKEIYEDYYIDSGAYSNRDCYAYACDKGFLLDKKVCKQQVCDIGTTETKDCKDIENATKCKYKCVNGLDWEFVSLEKCADGFRVEANTCVPDIKAGDSCKKQDLPQYATDGKYVKSGNSLKCLATKCQKGTYLVTKDGASQGWCVASAYCNDKPGTSLNIINGTTTDLQCIEPEKQSESPTSEQEDAQTAQADDGGQKENQNTESAQGDESAESEAVPASADTDSDIRNESQSAESQNDIQGPSDVPGNSESDDTEKEQQEETKDLTEQEKQKKVEKAQEKYDAAKENEQSLANRTLGAAAMGAGGIGGMMLASGLAEQNADENAEIDMRAYLATFRCDYGAGRNIRGGDTDVQLPGTSELIPLYAEYVALANDLKKRKEQLGLRPGIESEPILDSATTGLYEDVSVGTSSGAYTSLSRALQNPDGEDAKKWAAQAEENAKKVKNGATVGGAGIAGGAIGNLILNQDKD